MKILGYPVHMMLIHFPSALFPMSFIASAIGFYNGNLSFINAAFFTLAGGVIAGWFAVVAGALDILTVLKDKPAALQKALIHGYINAAVLIGFSLVYYKAYKSYPALAADSVVSLVIKGVLVMAMIVGNFIGGSLILKDKINVEK